MKTSCPISLSPEYLACAVAQRVEGWEMGWDGIGTGWEWDRDGMGWDRDGKERRGLG